ncbi:hypothetical protein DEO72_LG8g2554 [Vigna unguiculata]|uniref:Uncharacterized protein n=1 Tax=Vigna unguiculata TaxID=3917 RepID=A0A4D6MTS9_VIGUN|nr:hypothetical protein DEO72_LG8g2554 [Vigna unguiculata]
MASVVRGTEAIGPLLAPGLLGPRPIPLNSNHFLASGPTGPRPIPLFGTGFERTGAYTPLWLRVFGEPGPKTWL